MNKMLLAIRKELSIISRQSLRVLSTAGPSEEVQLGLFETEKEPEDEKEMKKKRGDLSIPGTLDAEVLFVRCHGC